MPIRFLDTLHTLKTLVGFCYRGGAMPPLLAARLLSRYSHLANRRGGGRLLIFRNFSDPPEAY